MPKKLDPITRANKDVAEFLFGHSPGRPTISRRTGRVMADVTGIHEDTCVDLFHLFLVVVGGSAMLKSALTPKPPSPQQGA